MKAKIKRIGTAILLIAVLLANLCVVSFADGENVITLEPIVAVGPYIVVEGIVSGVESQKVSVFVVPETVGSYTIDSVESFLDANSEGLLLENFVYASQKTCTSGSFRFAFSVTEPGKYVVLVSAEDSAAVLGTFSVLSFAKQLNTFKEDYAGFKAVVATDFGKTGATLADKYLLLTDSYRESVLQGLHGDIPFADNDDLSEKADAQIKTVIDGIVSSLKAEPVDVKKIIDTMRDMPEIFGVDSISAYDNSLGDDGRANVDSALTSGVVSCETPEDFGTIFDTEVEKEVLKIENKIVSELNSASDLSDFSGTFENIKDVIGLTKDELTLINRLSDNMLDEIFEAMISISDKSGDGKAEFANFEDVTNAFREGVEGKSDAAIALDIINNRANGDELIAIMKEYSSLLPELDMTGYEALGENDEVEYQKYVRDKFLAGDKDASLDKVAERFNSIVKDAEERKSLLDKINSQDYSGMIGLLSDDNMTLLGADSQTKSNYKYVKNNSDSEYTNLINELIKYMPYDSLEAFNSKLSEASKNFAGKIDEDDDSSPSRGSSKGGRDYVVSGSAPSVVTPSKTELFTDIDSVPWAKAQILALAERGIISGTGNGLFAPNQYVTREQFVKMLVEAFGLYNANAVCDFADVAKDSWYYGYVASGYEAGIVQGDGAGSFGAGQHITRQDMAVLAYRAYKAVKGDMTYIKDDVVFSDYSDIATYAGEAVEALAKAGYINGTGNGLFSPANVCTRAEAAVIIFNMIK